MKPITTLTIPSHFVETLKNGIKEHLILSDEERMQIFPLPYISGSNRKKKIILKDEETGEELYQVELSENNQNRISICRDGRDDSISISYTSTFCWPVEESDVLRLLKGDNFKTKQELIAFYIQYFRKKKQLCLDKSFSGILFTWGSFYKKLKKITDTEPENKFEKYAKK